MRATQFVTGMVLIGMMATPAVAQERRRERAPEQNEQRGGEQQRDRRGAATGRAVPREAVRPSPPPASQGRRDESPNAGRTNPSPPPASQGRRDESPNVGRTNQGRPGNGAGRNDRGYDNRSYDNRATTTAATTTTVAAAGRTYYPYYSNRGYGQRTIIVPRYIRPSFVTVVPYRPYLLSPEHRRRHLLRERRVLPLRLHAARLLRSDSRTSVWRPAHHGLLARRAGVRRRLLRRHRQRLRRHLPGRQPGGGSPPHRDRRVRAGSGRLRRDDPAGTDDDVPGGGVSLLTGSRVHGFTGSRVLGFTGSGVGESCIC